MIIVRRREKVPHAGVMNSDHAPVLDVSRDIERGRRAAARNPPLAIVAPALFAKWLLGFGRGGKALSIDVMLCMVTGTKAHRELSVRR